MKDAKKMTKEQKTQKAKQLMAELKSLELTDEELKQASGGYVRELKVISVAPIF